MHPEVNREAVEGFSGAVERVKRCLLWFFLSLPPPPHLRVQSRFCYPYNSLPWPKKVSLLER